MPISSDVFRGHTDTIILNILRKGDSYGYEITKAINDRSSGAFDIKDATIYTAFRRLESGGYITTYWGDGVGGARRRYYKITEAGVREYEARYKEWQLSQKLLQDLLGGDGYANQV